MSFRSAICTNLRSTVSSSQSRYFVRNYATRKPPDVKNPNFPVMKMLYEHLLNESNSPTQNAYKLRAFEHALRTISALPYQVERLQDVQGIKGIGKGILGRIEVFLASQRDAPSTSLNPPSKRLELVEAVKLFQTISGVGPLRARKIADTGARTLEDVRNNKELFDSLPKSIQVGFEYTSTMRTTVLREEIEALEYIIRRTLEPDFDVYIVGSYRRGAPTSSDIDVLLFHPRYDQAPAVNSTRKLARKEVEKLQETSPLLTIAVPFLTKAKVLISPLTSGTYKWQGIANLYPDSKEKKQMPYCRIDLNLLPTESRSAALLAFTGDSEFNRHMRAKAGKAGMRLNEFGLWRRPTGWVRTDKSDTKEDLAWKMVTTTSEKDIFDRLDETFVDPLKRNFRDRPSKSKKP